MTSATLAPGAPAPATPAPEAVATLSGVVRRYLGGRAVGPLDLEVRAGEVLALMGINGAGKSTVLRLLASADRPDAGSVRWWGGTSRTEARRRIGFAPDEPAEEGSLSVRQATHFWCAQWVPERATARRLTAEALAAWGLAERADEPVSTLSYGLRRRLALAQALAHRPALAALDEPSAGLDPEGSEVVTAALRGRAASGATTVVASNDPELVAAVADRVAILHEGRCLRVAALDTLLAELPRHRVVELRLRPGSTPGRDGEAIASRLRLAPGAVIAAQPGGSAAGPPTLQVELPDGASVAALVAAAEAAGADVQSLEVRRPDLRDCFSLLALPSRGGAPEGGRR